MRSGHAKTESMRASVSIPDTLLMPQSLSKVPLPPAYSICVRDDIWKVVGATLTSFFERSALKVNPVFLVHGGAWAIPDDMVEAHLAGVRAAIAAGWSVLEKGGSAVDAVEDAVVIMEDDEAFDAGRGSFLNRDGKVQLDALIMDGATLRAGGVGCVEHIANPIRAARKVLSESPHVYFVAEGAERFASEHGIPLCRNEDLIIPRELERLREYLGRGEDHREDIF